MSNFIFVVYEYVNFDNVLRFEGKENCQVTRIWFVDGSCKDYSIDPSALYGLVEDKNANRD